MVNLLYCTFFQVYESNIYIYIYGGTMVINWHLESGIILLIIIKVIIMAMEKRKREFGWNDLSDRWNATYWLVSCMLRLCLKSCSAYIATTESDTGNNFFFFFCRRSSWCWWLLTNDMPACYNWTNEYPNYKFWVLFIQSLWKWKCGWWKIRPYHLYTILCKCIYVCRNSSALLSVSLPPWRCSASLKSYYTLVGRASSPGIWTRFKS